MSKSNKPPMTFKALMNKLNRLKPSRKDTLIETITLARGLPANKLKSVLGLTNPYGRATNPVVAVSFYWVGYDDLPMFQVHYDSQRSYTGEADDLYLTPNLNRLEEKLHNTEDKDKFKGLLSEIKYEAVSAWLHLRVMSQFVTWEYEAFASYAECAKIASDFDYLADHSRETAPEVIGCWLSGEGSSRLCREAKRFQKKVRELMPENMFDYAEQMAQTYPVVQAFLAGKTHVKVGGIGFDLR